MWRKPRPYFPNPATPILQLLQLVRPNATTVANILYHSLWHVLTRNWPFRANQIWSSGSEVQSQNNCIQVHGPENAWHTPMQGLPCAAYLHQRQGTPSTRNQSHAEPSCDARS
eukprot:gnl/MRDRNA2_/MRDRNA2_83233_c0_seq2.p1 gnl/MRDRNA2_/MRDRNA2_83233_c0~~gnl/MRDRNA2_/MRDRNA2_83233_c0_seq2.p1  ORF type:complete len:113 (-),score=10.16 gnl/MRDRNA2_/MRDRNA2_83233_c0_seq2:112-450(-)